jgi:cytochrome c5
MADVHIEEHSSPIKTPQQLVVVVLLSFIVPVAAILLIVKLITGGLHVDPDSSAMTEEAIASRLKPVGEVSVASTPSGDTAAAAGGGEEVFNTVCQSCHAAGLAGAPKVGDKAAWKARIAQGIDVLYASVINGKNLMPARGGAMNAPDEDIKAAVDLMVSRSR